MSEMKMTPEQIEIVVKKVNLFAPHTCSFCKNEQLELSDSIFELREFASGNLVVGGNSSVYPVIALCCRNCGQSVFMNAIVLGILSRPEDVKQNDGTN
jgi:hypothetical protein